MNGQTLTMKKQRFQNVCIVVQDVKPRFTLILDDIDQICLRFKDRRVCIVRCYIQGLDIKLFIVRREGASGI